MVDYGDNVTTYAYAYIRDQATGALGLYGGWRQTTNSFSGHSSKTLTDHFGHVITREDLGGHDYAYSYDKAGRVVEQTSSAGQEIDYTWLNTGLLGGSVDNSSDSGMMDYWDWGWGGTDTLTHVTATYGYDAAGRRTKEKYSTLSNTYNTTTGALVSSTTLSHQDATAAYDALGRMTSYADTGASGSNAVSTSYKYDLNGNVREAKTDYDDQVSGTPKTQDYWYKYDSMNRFTLVKGYLDTSAHQIVRWNPTALESGTELQYDLSGQRTLATTTVNLGYTLASQSEAYAYTEDGYLSSVTERQWWSGYDTSHVVVENQRDALGRIKDYKEYTLGGTLQYQRTSTYNYRMQVTSEHIVQSGQPTLDLAYSYQDDTGRDIGVLTWAHGSHVDNRTTYEWWDGAVQHTLTENPDTDHYDDTTSTFYYDAGGKLERVYVNDGHARSISYVTDVSGQILRRDDSTGPTQLSYYFGGLKVGELGDNGAVDVDYATAISRRQSPGQSWGYAYGAKNFADFDQAYDPINPSSSGEAQSIGRYTVRAGDTLASIAQRLWGDASLWFMLSDANGLISDAGLAPGLNLAIPGKVANLHNTSSTFKPYDPNAAVGNVDPSVAIAKPVPPPDNKHHCGIGQVMVAIIAIAVTAWLLGPASAFFGSEIIGGAVAGAVGSLAGQVVGVATGVQDSIDWKGVALSAIGSGIGAGLGSIPGLGTASGPGHLLGNLGRGLVRGALGGAITQGIGVATGLQDQFSWASVAVSGIVGGVGAAVSGALPYTWSGTANTFVSGAAGAIAGAGAQTLLTGSDFGDNLMSALPSVIGNTIGNAIAGGFMAQGDPQSIYANGAIHMGQESMDDALGNPVGNAISQINAQGSELQDFMDRRNGGGAEQFALAKSAGAATIAGPMYNPNNQAVTGNARLVVNNNEHLIRVIIPISNAREVNNLNDVLSIANQNILDPSNNNWSISFEARSGSLVNSNGDAYTNTLVFLDSLPKTNGFTLEYPQNFEIRINPESYMKTFVHEIAGHVSGLADVYVPGANKSNSYLPMNLMNNDSYSSSAVKLDWGQVRMILSSKTNDVIYTTHGTSEPIIRRVKDAFGN